MNYILDDQCTLCKLQKQIGSQQEETREFGRYSLDFWHMSRRLKDYRTSIQLDVGGKIIRSNVRS